MNEINLNGIESLRIVRADGHLTLSGGSSSWEVDCHVEPDVTRDGDHAEISFRAHATLRIPAGVAIEVADCEGHLEVEDLATPLVVGRIGGHLRAHGIGALSIRSRIGGGARIERAGAIDGDTVSGTLRVETARSILLTRVGGNFDASGVEMTVAIERIGGNASVEKIEGAVRLQHVGGNFRAERAGEVEIDSIGGKARIVDPSGNVQINKIGGRLAMLGAAADVKVASVGGHASVSDARGGVELRDVGGAVDLRGPFPSGKFWGVQSRGRISVEVDSSSALDLTASSGWGRVRVFGLDTANLQRLDRGRVKGTLGAAKPAEERTRMALDTRHADIIFAPAGAYERDYCWSGRGARGWRRYPGSFEELGEIFSEEFGEKFPDFMSSILGAAGEIFAHGGRWSESVFRGVAEEASRTVRDARTEAERAFAELGEKLPRDIARSIEEFGRRLAEIIRRAAVEGLGRSREGREQARERVREAARQMAASIRDAVREARRQHEQRKEEPSAGASRTRPFTSASRRDDIMDILNGVKEGRIDPREADEMIAALMEVEKATEGRSS